MVLSALLQLFHPILCSKNGLWDFGKQSICSVSFFSLWSCYYVKMVLTIGELCPSLQIPPTHRRRTMSIDSKGRDSTLDYY